MIKWAEGGRKINIILCVLSFFLPKTYQHADVKQVSTYDGLTLVTHHINTKP